MISPLEIVKGPLEDDRICIHIALFPLWQSHRRNECPVFIIVLELLTQCILKLCLNSLVLQWLGLYASTSGTVGSVPSQGTKIPHAKQSQKKKKMLC